MASEEKSQAPTHTRPVARACVFAFARSFDRPRARLPVWHEGTLGGMIMELTSRVLGHSLARLLACTNNLFACFALLAWHCLPCTACFALLAPQSALLALLTHSAVLICWLAYPLSPRLMGKRFLSNIVVVIVVVVQRLYLIPFQPIVRRCGMRVRNGARPKMAFYRKSLLLAPSEPSPGESGPW